MSQAPGLPTGGGGPTQQTVVNPNPAAPCTQTTIPVTRTRRQRAWAFCKRRWGWILAALVLLALLMIWWLIWHTPSWFSKTEKAVPAATQPATQPTTTGVTRTEVVEAPMLIKLPTIETSVKQYIRYTGKGPHYFYAVFPHKHAEYPRVKPEVLLERYWFGNKDEDAWVIRPNSDVWVTQMFQVVPHYEKQRIEWTYDAFGKMIAHECEGITTSPNRLFQYGFGVDGKEYYSLLPRDGRTETTQVRTEPPLAEVLGSVEIGAKGRIDFRGGPNGEPLTFNFYGIDGRIKSVGPCWGAIGSCPKEKYLEEWERSRPEPSPPRDRK